MVAPSNRFLKLQQVWLKLLYHLVTLVEYRVEPHIVEVKALDLVAGSSSRSLVQQGQLSGKGPPFVGVAAQDDDFFGARIAKKVHL